MRRSSTARPEWVPWALDAYHKNMPYHHMAEVLRGQGTRVEWSEIKHLVQRELGIDPPLLPWPMPESETGEFVAVRLRLLVRRHRGDTLFKYEEQRIEQLLGKMRTLRAEVVRWDGKSWEYRGRRKRDREFDSVWYPPLIVQ